jgi:ribosome maturation factor RimP
MAENELENTILADAEPVVRGMGFEIVEVRALRTKTGVRVYMSIYSPQGVSLDSCADVLKTLRPRLQMLTADPDLYIEVSSPGLDRTLKSPREYRIFQGRGLRLLATGENEWRRGLIAEVTDRGLTLQTDGAFQTFAFQDIRKAKLDSQEGM